MKEEKLTVAISTGEVDKAISKSIKLAKKLKASLDLVNQTKIMVDVVDESENKELNIDKLRLTAENTILEQSNMALREQIKFLSDRNQNSNLEFTKNELHLLHKLIRVNLQKTESTDSNFNLFQSMINKVSKEIGDFRTASKPLKMDSILDELKAYSLNI